MCSRQFLGRLGACLGGRRPRSAQREARRELVRHAGTRPGPAWLRAGALHEQSPVGNHLATVDGRRLVQDRIRFGRHCRSPSATLACSSTSPVASMLAVGSQLGDGGRARGVVGNRGDLEQEQGVAGGVAVAGGAAATRGLAARIPGLEGWESLDRGRGQRLRAEGRSAGSRRRSTLPEPPGNSVEPSKPGTMVLIQNSRRDRHRQGVAEHPEIVSRRRFTGNEIRNRLPRGTRWGRRATEP